MNFKVQTEEPGASHPSQPENWSHTKTHEKFYHRYALRKSMRSHLANDGLSHHKPHQQARSSNQQLPEPREGKPHHHRHQFHSHSCSDTELLTKTHCANCIVAQFQATHH